MHTPSTGSRLDFPPFFSSMTRRVPRELGRAEIRVPDFPLVFAEADLEGNQAAPPPAATVQAATAALTSAGGDGRCFLPYFVAACCGPHRVLPHRTQTPTYPLTICAHHAPPQSPQ
jgi:hypothetical protein